MLPSSLSVLKESNKLLCSKFSNLLHKVALEIIRKAENKHSKLIPVLLAPLLRILIKENCVYWIFETYVATKITSWENFHTKFIDDMTTSRLTQHSSWSKCVLFPNFWKLEMMRMQNKEERPLSPLDWENQGSELLRFQEGIAATPLVLDRHLKHVPSGQEHCDSLEEKRVGLWLNWWFHLENYEAPSPCETPFCVWPLVLTSSRLSLSLSLSPPHLDRDSGDRDSGGWHCPNIRYPFKRLYGYGYSILY